MNVHVVELISDAGEWRSEARRLLAAGLPPEQVVWGGSPNLLGGLGPKETPAPADKAVARTVPRAFLSLAETIACHRDPGKWALLYRLLWRLTHGEPKLLNVSVDDDVFVAERLQRDVRRDAHKMKAFVRFRKVPTAEGPHYVAWHRPDHPIVRYAAPFFVRRFQAMRWTILTPDAAASWDGTGLTFGPGVPRSAAPAADEWEDVWRTYYASVFNPARVNVRLMQKEMPVRHWATLPEAEIIHDLLREAPKRVDEMARKAEKTDTPSAAAFLPPTLELPALVRAAADCQGCPLWKNATQTVFGEGPAHAACMFVGEQPGDQEDLSGKPFVGPAGQLLNRAMQEAGVPRDDVYVTNAVKHFKWEPRGKRRIHAKPSAREVAACRAVARSGN